MDPKQTLLDAVAAFKSGDLIALNECLDSYAQWRGRDGYMPEILIAGDDLFELLVTYEEASQ